MWGKRREPMSKCFEAREADDILNICPKDQGVFSLVSKIRHYWISRSSRHCTRIPPRNQEPSRVCSAHGCRVWRRTAAGRAPGVLPISVQQQICRGKCSQLICSHVWSKLCHITHMFSYFSGFYFFLFKGSFEV